ncbi:MAG: HAMP domain-containing sensor histidine kinase [Oscillospiraceae bacterium]
MKIINQLKLLRLRKKKTISDKIYSWHVKSDAISMLVFFGIILLTNAYNINFQDSFAILIILFVMTFIIMSIVDKHQLDKYFRPLQELVNHSNRISDGKDLSKRLVFDNKSNHVTELELLRISRTFNRMTDRLEKSFEHERQFSRNISHEIKTPLSVIISCCEYAQDFTDDPEEMQDTLKTISEQANRISDITSKLSSLAKMDGNNQKLDYEDFCLNELVQITADEVSIEYENQHKNIQINIHADDNITVHADRIMIVRLFVNLISNSVKYGVKDGTTDIYLTKKGNSVECVISDNGIGISEENLENIWQPFFRVDHSNQNSTGLGLSMVKKIVAIHGGYINVDSVLNKGTTFKLSMPIAK